MRMTYVSGVCVLCLLAGVQMPGRAAPPASRSYRKARRLWSRSAHNTASSLP